MASFTSILNTYTKGLTVRDKLKYGTNCQRLFNFMKMLFDDGINGEIKENHKKKMTFKYLPVLGH